MGGKTTTFGGNNRIPVKEAHEDNQWKSRFLHNILRTGMINSWVFAQSYEYHSLIRYGTNGR